MRVTETAILGVLIVEPKVHGDDRGFFLETWHAERYAAAGIREPFVQDNHSRSQPGVLRGLHFQVSKPQGKLVRCVRGAIWDVAADIRSDSPTYGCWVGVELSEENHRQLWIPPGLAHGFCVPERVSEVEYKCTALYDQADESGVIWNDPRLGIAWPGTDWQLSERDRGWDRLR